MKFRVSICSRIELGSIRSLEAASSSYTLPVHCRDDDNDGKQEVRDQEPIISKFHTIPSNDKTRFQ